MTQFQERPNRLGAVNKTQRGWVGNINIQAAQANGSVDAEGNIVFWLNERDGKNGPFKTLEAFDVSKSTPRDNQGGYQQGQQAAYQGTTPPVQAPAQQGYTAPAAAPVQQAPIQAPIQAPVQQPMQGGYAQPVAQPLNDEIPF